ncbi:unnamed protein product, partial [Lymnaea stagnalis]
MCPAVRYATLLLGLASLIYCTTTGLELNVKYNCNNSTCTSSQSFNFSDADLKSLRDCVCQLSWDDCSYDHIGNEEGWKWRANKSAKVSRHAQFNHFECQLVQTDSIACGRREIGNITKYKGFLHKDMSEGICARISWNAQQKAYFIPNKNTIFSVENELTENIKTLSSIRAILSTVTTIGITNLMRTEFIIFQQTSKEYSTMPFDTNGNSTANHNYTEKEFIVDNTIIIACIVVGILAIVSIVFGTVLLFVKRNGKTSTNATTDAIEGDRNYDYVTIDSDILESTVPCPADAITDESKWKQSSETQHYSTASQEIHLDVRHWGSEHQRNRVSSDSSMKPAALNVYSKLSEETKT